MPTFDQPPALVPVLLVEMAMLVACRPGARARWHVETKLADNPSAYDLTVQHGRMTVSAHFNVERGVFRILDYEPHEWIDASTPQEAAAAIERVLDRPPKLMSETPANAPTEFLEIVTRVRELAPRFEILWDRERSKRADAWENVLVVETPHDERFAGQAVCYFDRSRKMWGIGIGVGATQADWSSTPAEAAQAILRHVGHRAPP